MVGIIQFSCYLHQAFNKSDLIKKKDLNKKISEFKIKINSKYKIISIFNKDDIQAVKRTLITNVNK